MANEITCSNPECGRLLRLPENRAGEIFKCPSCGQIQPDRRDESEEPDLEALFASADAAFSPGLPASKSGDTAEEPVLPKTDEIPSTERRVESHIPRSQDSFVRETQPRLTGWRTVYQGLGLLRASAFFILSTLMMILVWSFFSLMVAFEPWEMRSVMTAARWLLPLAVLCGFIGGFVLQIGLAFCCAAPEESHGKGWAITAFVCSVNVISVLFVCRFFEPVATVPRSEMFFESRFSLLFPPVTFAMCCLMCWAGHFLFVLCLHRISKYFTEPRLSTRTVVYMYYSVAVLLISGVLGSSIPVHSSQLSLWAVNEPQSSFPQIYLSCSLMLILGLLGLGMIWFLRLLRLTRKTISEFLVSQPGSSLKSNMEQYDYS